MTDSAGSTAAGSPPCPAPRHARRSPPPGNTTHEAPGGRCQPAGSLICSACSDAARHPVERPQSGRLGEVVWLEPYPELLPPEARHKVTEDYRAGLHDSSAAPAAASARDADPARCARLHCRGGRQRRIGDQRAKRTRSSLRSRLRGQGQDPPPGEFPCRNPAGRPPSLLTRFRLYRVRASARVTKPDGKERQPCQLCCSQAAC